MDQELFEKYYPLYSKVLRICGLMPFDTSLLAIIKRAVYIGLLLFCFYAQLLNLRKVEKTLANLVWMLSYTSAMTLFGLRYCSFVFHRKTTKRYFIDIGHDIDAVTDPVEIEIFAKYTTRTRLLVIAYLGLAAFLVAYTSYVLVVPTLLHTQKQLYYLRLYGFIFMEQSSQVDVLCLSIFAVTVMGIYSVVGTESTLAVYSSYLCGLIEISSYQINMAIQNSENKDSSVLIKVQPPVELQRKALSFVSSFRYHGNISGGK